MIEFFYSLLFALALIFIFGFFFLCSLISTYCHAYFRAKGRKKAGSRFF